MRKKSGDIKEFRKQNSNRLKFIVELVVAILLSVSCALFGMTNLLWASNLDYPYTVDGLGHMTKVVYIAQQLAQGHIPSWFPYWYNTSTTTQYYVPFSYYIMAFIYYLTQNVMLTYKIFCAAVMAIGGFGVWVLCYKKIGRVCGLFGIIIFCFQPFLLNSLYVQGFVAQGPIIAMMSWYLLAVLSCAKKPNRCNFSASTILMILIILSHAMHAFMVFLTTFVVFLIFLLLKKVQFRNLIITGITVLLAGLLTAFWSLVGSTQLENAGVPYLLPEASFTNTANFNWFLPDQGMYYFSIISTALIAISILVYFNMSIFKKNNEDCKYYGLAAIILSVVTIVFSFGMNLPGFQLLPLSSSLVAGRILTYTAVSAAIAAAYFVKMLWGIKKVKILIRPIVLLIIAASLWEMQPYSEQYEVIEADYYNSTAEYMDVVNSNFNKGRYQWYGPINSSESFFPVQLDYNLSDGWNIEGTVHNQELWNNNIALSTDCADYTLKQIVFWNVRYLLINNKYQALIDELAKSELDFEKAALREEATLYVSDLQPSYYLKDSRNALAISSSTQGFNIEYPNFILGRSEDISEYPFKELSKYKLVYIIEPDINTRSKKLKFEAKVTELVNAGVTVLIEPVVTKNFDVFGVTIKDESCNSSPVLSVTEDCPYPIEDIEIKNNSHISVIRSLHGLDETYINYTLQDRTINNAILGVKNVGKGKVIFIGAHMSQYLKPVYARNFGLQQLDDIIRENSSIIESVYNEIFSYYGVEENYLPETVQTILQHNWGYDGGEFTYRSDTAQEVTLSVSYSPRWSVLLDGSEIEVGQCENLITLYLPAGEHRVKLHYGITIYGLIGYGISAVGIFIFIMFLCLWKWNMKVITNTSEGLTNYLQLEGSNADIYMGIKDETATTMTDEIEFDSDESEVISEKSNIYMDDNNTKFEMEPDFIADETIIHPYIIYNAIHEDGVTVELYEMDEESEPDSEPLSIACTTSDEMPENYTDVSEEVKPEINNPTSEQIDYERSEQIDYERILRKASYENQRNWLQKHYDDLKEIKENT